MNTLKKSATITVISLIAMGISPDAASAAGKSSLIPGPQTTLHYAGNAGYSAALASCGFNLWDVSSVSALNSLPDGNKGLVWLGLCNGADANFISTVQPFIGNPKLFGFYLIDEPDPTGQWHPLCAAANLKAEVNWIHANVPGAITFLIMMNMSSETSPSFANSYNPTNTGFDLWGIDPYPCRKEYNGNCNYDEIGLSVNAAIANGISLEKIVPIYQAFGGGGYASWTMPTPAQEQQILATWGQVVPNPVFDYVYSYGSQVGDTALVSSPNQLAVFCAHNKETVTPATAGFRQVAHGAPIMSAEYFSLSGQRLPMRNGKVDAPTGGLVIGREVDATGVHRAAGPFVKYSSPK